VAVAFVSGCGYAFVLQNIPRRGGWPSGDLIVGVGLISALVAAPVALVVGLLVALPLFLYWVRRSPAPLGRSLLASVAMALAAAALVETTDRLFGFFSFSTDRGFALLTVALAAPISAMAVYTVGLTAVRASPNNRWRGP
jgi:hypothetical protein